MPERGGHGFQVFVTDLADPDIAYLEALHRGRGRAEKRICNAKDTGLANLLSASFATNTAWLVLVLTAQDLMSWAKLVCFDGELALAEPNRLCYCVLHTIGIVVRHSRQHILRLAANWPRTPDLAVAFTRLAALPLRT